MPNTLIAQLNNPAVLMRINQRAATVMSVLLIIACAYLLVEMTWLLFPQGDSVTLPAQQKINSANNKQAKQEQFRKLTSVNIFGLAQTTTAQPPPTR